MKTVSQSLAYVFDLIKTEAASIFAAVRGQSRLGGRARLDSPSPAEAISGPSGQNHVRSQRPMTHQEKISMMANTNGKDRTGLSQDGQRPRRAADTKAVDIRQRPHGPADASQSGLGGASHDDIARRAYDIYEKKGRTQGQCKQNWLQAERELNQQDCAGASSALRT